MTKELAGFRGNPISECQMLKGGNRIQGSCSCVLPEASGGFRWPVGLIEQALVIVSPLIAAVIHYSIWPKQCWSPCCV